MFKDKVCTFEKVPKEIFIEDALPHFLVKPKSEADSLYEKYGVIAPEEVLEKIWEEIQLPRRATHGSVGYDFFLPWDIQLDPHQPVYIPSGICCNFNTNDSNRAGFYLGIYPKSGLGFKYQLVQAETVGIIDEDYYNSRNHGHISIKLIPNFFVDGFTVGNLSGINGMEINRVRQLYHNDNKMVVLKQGMPYVQGIIQEAFGATNDDPTIMKKRDGGLGSTTKK